MVRSPCTLVWPRTGHAPAPGLPMLPRSSRKLTISARCRRRSRAGSAPSPSETIVARDSMATRAAARIDFLRHAARRLPARPTSRAASADDQLLEALGVLVDERAVDDAPGARCSSSSIAFITPWKNATSPLMRTGTCIRASGVASPSSATGSCGCAKRIVPTSASGLTLTMVAPRFAAASSVVSIRGWLVPGFWPTTKIASAGLEVLELHRALADADRLLEPRAARLVAHVRAVGQVVRAEARARRAGRGTPPRCSSGPTCRRAPRRARRARAAGAPRARRRRPRRSARSASTPGRRTIGSHEASLVVEPVVAARRELATRRERAKNVGVGASRRGLAQRPPWRRSRRTRSSPRSSGSGQAQPGQSKPEVWLVRASTRAPRARPV